MNNGELRKAIRLVNSYGVEELTDEVVQQVKVMHPKRTEAVKLPTTDEIKDELKLYAELDNCKEEKVSDMHPMNDDLKM